jgi:phosphatidylserine decarboxylase
MAIEGDSAAARALFEQAWSIRRDDYDACVAAHFLARHQPTPELTLHWNALAVQHAEAVQDGRADGFFASLYLNLGDAHRVAGNCGDATTAVAKARAALTQVPAGGYRDFVTMGIDRLERRIAETR